MKKIISVLIILSFLLSLVSFNTVASNFGAKFSNAQHSMKKPLDFTPRTFDAVIYLPKSHEGRGGVIMGNYGSGTDCINFEIYNNGMPRLYYVDSSGNVYNYIFSDVDVRTNDSPVRITMVQDPSNKKISCYINGIEKQSIDADTLPNDLIINRSQYIGGDPRSGNAQYFKGIIYSYGLYSDALTSDQINSNDKSSIVVDYDFSVSKDQNIDLSGNGYNLSGELQIVDTDDLITPEPEIEGGLTFDSSSQYITSNDGLTETPYTYSAWIYLSKNHNDRGGVILGNYESGGVACVNIEVHASGAPRFYHIDSNNRIIDATFNNVDVRRGKWVHLAFTVGDVVTCYLDGEKVGQRHLGEFDKAATDLPLALGGDLRSGNSQNFKGKIKEIVLYNEKLSDSDISNLYSKGNNDFSSKVIAHFDMNNIENGKNIDDKSGNGNIIYIKSKFFDNKETNDFSYSFAFIGDTQVITQSYPDKLSKIYDWLINNKDIKKIEYVFGLGDITNNDTDLEWVVAKKQISKLDGIIPYSLARGNHDSSNMFKKYFDNQTYKNQFEGFYNNSINNSWRTFKVGKVNYLFITLDYGPNDDVLNWAADIIESHPNHQVIITTHSYMFRDGTTLDDKDVCPPSSTGGTNDGDDMWEKLISKHENIVLVVSGHDPCDKIITTQTKGEKGNTVTQILIDPQGVDASIGATGMVALFHFSEDGSEIQVEYYSTVLDKYFLEENQFNISLPVSHLNTDESSESADYSDIVSIESSVSNNNTENKNDNTIYIIIASIVAVVIFVSVIIFFKRQKLHK